jgi:type IX secretion system PorP/SprF family membrane protein
MLNVHMPFYLWHGALGFQLVNETLGAEKQNGVLMSYNYIYESEVGLISGGLRAGIYQNSLDGTKLRTPDGTYEGSLIDHQDVTLPNSMISGISPVLEAGVYFAGDYFEAGLSMTDFFPAGITLGDNLNFSPKPGFHFFGEYFIESFDQISIYPVVYIKSDLVQSQAELSVRAEWQDLFMAGVGYRRVAKNSRDAMIFSAGVRLSEKF